MELLPRIKQMLSEGMTQKEVEDALGLTGYRPVHELLKRERKKEQQGLPKQRGRKPAKTLQEYKYTLIFSTSFGGKLIDRYFFRKVRFLESRKNDGIFSRRLSLKCRDDLALC